MEPKARTSLPPHPAAAAAADKPRVHVLIATCDRPRLLAERALASVLQQTLPPSSITIVNDSRSTGAYSVEEAVRDVLPASWNVRVLSTASEHGAAAAWNVGLRHLFETCDGDDFVAILDDDDRWSPSHLEQCAARASEPAVDVVVAPLWRVCGPTRKVVAIAPEQICEEAFLVSNPGIQGSNLFVRLATLVRAGGFDSLLPSCTDRDLCIRLLDVGAGFAVAPAPTVEHHAEMDRARLTTDRSGAKREGLAHFYRKYGHRMSPAVRERFFASCQDRHQLSREELEAFELDSAPVRANVQAGLPAWETPPHRPGRDEAHAGELPLVVGVIATPGHVERIERMAGDLVRLGRDARVSSLDLVVLFNGHFDAGDVDRLTREVRDKAIDLYPAEVAADGPGAARQLPIAQARERLKGHMVAVGRARPGAAGWILDDDMRLDPNLNYVDVFLSARERGLDILIGDVEGAAPLPFASTLTCQLVDLSHAVRELLRDTADSPVTSAKNPQGETEALRRILPEYWYDYSATHTRHLEARFPVPWPHDVANRSAALAFLAQQAPRLLAGEPLSRGLLRLDDSDPLAQAEASVACGGNTIAFDIEDLVRVPHASPCMKGVQARRSDMMWAAGHRYLFNRRVYKAPVVVLHDRRDVPPSEDLDVGRMRPDMYGAAAYRALSWLLRTLPRRDVARRSPGQEPPFPSRALVADAAARMESELAERVVRLRWGLARAEGALRSIVRALQSEGWWGEAPHCVARDALIAFAERLMAQLGSACGQPMVASPREREGQSVREGFEQFVLTFFETVRERSRASASQSPMTVKPDVLRSWFDEHRIESARASVAQMRSQVPECGSARASALRLLGVGSEGVVLTDGMYVFKRIDYLKRPLCPETLARLMERTSGSESPMPRLLNAWRGVGASRALVLRSEFVPTRPYAGGNLRGAVELLRRLRRCELVSTNVRPKNLRQQGGRLLLVDVGADIQLAETLTSEDWSDVARQLWVSARHGHRSDAFLGDCIREARQGTDVPETRGAERLLQAATAVSPVHRVYEELIGRLSRNQARRVLDYGCGRGHLVKLARQAGIEAFGWDPKEPRCGEKVGTEGASESTIQTTGAEPEGISRDLQGPPAGWGSFEAIVCSLVLCVLDESEFRTALRGMRSRLADGGRAYVSICHPDATCTGNTLYQDRHVQGPRDPESTFVWHKRVGTATLRDVHRPMNRVRSLFAEAGLRIENTATCYGPRLIDLRDVPEFLVFEAVAGSEIAPEVHPVRTAQRTAKSPVCRVLSVPRVLPDAVCDEVSRAQRLGGAVVSDRRLRQVVRRYRDSIVSWDQWLTTARGEDALPPNSVLLTFDNATADFWHHAWPVLREERVPAVVFANRDGCAHGILGPVERLYLRLERADLDAHDRLEWVQGSRMVRFLAASPEGQREMLAELETLAEKPVLANRDTEDARFAASYYMNEAQLTALADAGVMLGSHGAQHGRLTALGSDESSAGVEAGARWVQWLLSRERHAIPFAYPNGAVSRAAMQTVSDAGHDFAFGWADGVDAGESLALPRELVKEESR